MKDISVLIRAITIKFYTPSSNPEEKAKKEVFNLYTWFFFESSLVYVSDCDPIKPCLYKVKVKGILMFSQDSCIFRKVYLNTMQKNMPVQELCLRTLEISGVQKTGKQLNIL